MTIKNYCKYSPRRRAGAMYLYKNEGLKMTLGQTDRHLKGLTTEQLEKGLNGLKDLIEALPEQLVNEMTEFSTLRILFEGNINYRKSIYKDS